MLYLFVIYLASPTNNRKPGGDRSGDSIGKDIAGYGPPQIVARFAKIWISEKSVYSRTFDIRK